MCVKVNCAALPTELLESELFGFERGAFTGAIQHKPGKFEFANQGTMFLDEISEMQLPLQSKLLQVLQDGEFSRLGGLEDVHVDVRVVAATNRDLEQAVMDGQFREDLFFRLNVVCITLPPLRQRRDEIPELTELFLDQYSEHYNRPRLALASDTMRLLCEHEWPGNVRELENIVKRMIILGSDDQVRRDWPENIAGRLAPTARFPPCGGRASLAAAAPAVPASIRRPAARPVAETRGGKWTAVDRFPQGHRPQRGAGSGEHYDLPNPSADALEPARGGRAPRHQLQSAVLQDQGSEVR